MIGQTLRHPPQRGHDVNIHVAIVLTSEGNHRPIGGKDGVSLRANACREAFGISTGAAYDPQIARVDEDKVRAINCWLLEKRWVLSLSEADNRHAEPEQDC